MHITKKQLDALREFFDDYEIDEDWLIRHINIIFDNSSFTIILTIDNMNEQEFDSIKNG